MRKRKMARTILIMPIAIILWAIGWSIFSADSKGPRRPKVKHSTQKDLTFIVPMPEQTQIATQISKS